MNAQLTKAEARVLRWLEAADFDNTGCRHSQKTIAAGAQCGERTVIRATQRLRDLGLIDIEKERRPRCKWPCNVYRVRHWNPRKRSGVLNILAARREAFCAEWQTERTATASKGSDRCGKPSTPRCLAVGSTSAVVARRDFEIRRLRMDQRRRHLHVADLTCLHCTEKDKRIQWLEESNRTYAENQTRLTEEVSGAQAAARATGKVLDQVTRELAAQKAYVKSLQTKMANRVVTDEQVEEIIDHWCHHRPKTRREESFPEGGKRRKLIEGALKLMAGAEGGPVQAVKEAIDGLHIAPWETYGRRSMQKEGPKSQLKNRIEHALADETKIEKCRAIRKWARGDSADHAWELCQVAGATYWALTELTQERIRERRRGPVEPKVEAFTVDGLRVRSDGR